MSMICIARCAGRQLRPRLHTLMAASASAPVGLVTSTEACLPEKLAWPSATPMAACAMVRGFAAPAQTAPVSEDSRLETPPEHAQAAAKRGKASGAAGAAEAESLDSMRPATNSRADGGKPADQEAPPARSQGTYWLMQPVYRTEYVESIQPKHLPPKKLREQLAMRSINTVRWAFDRVSGYGPNMNEKLWLRRIIYLETVAGVPGMVAGMLRHLHSLRRMKRDHGWIHTLLEEAENERMHLLTFMTLRQPGYFFRASVLIAQGVFFNFYFLAYLISPRFCHSFVGYLEEEAVKTYTRSIEDLDAGKLPEWKNLAAPDIAKKYWKLGENAGMRELLLAVRADEAGHSHVNHVLSKLKPDEDNPFEPGSHEVP